MKIFTKETLIEELIKIREMGWIENRRDGNHGGVGNTIEDLLGIEENNLPIPNAAEWELKCQRKEKGRGSLTTLFHCEPSPTAIKFVSNMLLPGYGWKHKGAGVKYPSTEMSFRQTISCSTYSDRGFKVELDKKGCRVAISFDYRKVDDRHSKWLIGVKEKAGLENLNPQPYWGFDDIFYKLGSKLHNCFYIQADVKRDGTKTFFKYEKIFILTKLSIDKFLKGFDEGLIYVDFDARTGHNHGTKFRLKNSRLPELYGSVSEI